jgi:hypothetical protein
LDGGNKAFKYVFDKQPLPPLELWSFMPPVARTKILSVPEEFKYFYLILLLLDKSLQLEKGFNIMMKRYYIN